MPEVTAVAATVMVMMALASVVECGPTTWPSPECSGQGVLYADVGVCECFDCFSGANCSKVDAGGCVVNAVGGSPLMYQSYWAQYDGPPVAAEVALPAWYRTGYQFESVLTPASTGLGAALREAILDVHASAGNVNTEGMSVVVGSGCTLLIAASSVALAEAAPCEQTTIYAQPPYYDGYANWASVGAANTSFSASSSLDPQRQCIVEFVTLPNNPTGELRSAVYSGSQVAHVHDMVYAWPSLTNKIHNYSADIMLFSLSKLSGHAGSRIGWALVKDPAVAAAMESFISKAEITTSVDSRYRALAILRAITATRGGFFSAIRTEFTARWNKVLPIFASSTRFAIRSVPDQFYLWIECLDGSTSCYDVFLAAGIQGWAGPSFGASDAFVRLELVQHDLVFDILLTKLAALVAA
ncbi:alliin lyase [Thecamonas trahens ATCC 50062]|uniref:Alliin lyase n=1 Tax=Thecamonas trahens ATCC 50062 TaxID=461836 RepID=A0A0L0DGT3_THETB|nr:alliin lyase [Thecamonas trahens ATCC 50062]KNC51326.1 alliin lyase [Thecamonas trahens ATCC 50062]|eukprot:XP_013756247.1 alliin lyase [Thecamonas trahens ATCC 50062]